MQIVNDKPPIYDRVAEVFPLSGGEIFAWGNQIYNPAGFRIMPWLIEHEKVHQKQQGDDVEGWWERYLVDAEFRFEMELEAHRREYRVYCSYNKDRNKQAWYRRVVAGKLAAPLYGNLITVNEAMRRLK